MILQQNNNQLFVLAVFIDYKISNIAIRNSRANSVLCPFQWTTKTQV